MDNSELDALLDRFASDVAEALGHALRASDKEWKVPLVPLTIGLNCVTWHRHPWRSWQIRFTWLVEDTRTETQSVSARSALMQLDKREINELATGFTDALREPMRQAYNDRYIIFSFVPLMVGTTRYKAHVNKKRWWTWEIRFSWVYER